MTVFDFVVLALVGASTVSGALRGLVRALVTVVALICGLLLAARVYEAAGALLLMLGLTESQGAAQAGGFIAVMGFVLVLGFVVGHFLSRRLKKARFGWFDRALGAGFGILRGFFVCSALYLALTAFPVRFSSVEESRTAPLLAEGAKILAAFTSKDVRASFLDQYKR